MAGWSICSVFLSSSPRATHKHGRHLPELSLAPMSRKLNQSIWNMKGMSTYTRHEKTASCPLSSPVKTSPRQIKANIFEEWQGGYHVALNSSCVTPPPAELHTHISLLQSSSALLWFSKETSNTSDKYRTLQLSLTSDIPERGSWAFTGITAAPDPCSSLSFGKSVCKSVCSVAAELLLWHVDTALPLVSASGLRSCRLGRLPDSCFGIALRLLFPSEASLLLHLPSLLPLLLLLLSLSLCALFSLFSLYQQQHQQHLCMSVLSLTQT